MTNEDFRTLLGQTVGAVNQRLGALLSADLRAGEHFRPPSLLAAMRHGVLNGGKRLRPFLLMECAGLFDVQQTATLQAACALECLHSYSLIHDDLPAMDNDDLRRGMPTVHKAFDEATAILAGDALLTLAFDLIADEDCHADPQVRSVLVSLLARAAGMGGMIGGQVLDILAETGKPDESEIRQLQIMKTGALIRYACEAGAVMGGAGKTERQNLVQFGETIGLAFQLADDLLDVTSDSAAMGKSVGKDEGQGKGTLVGIHGVDGTRALLEDLMVQANEYLALFGDRAVTLKKAAQFIVNRQN